MKPEIELKAKPGHQACRIGHHKISKTVPDQINKYIQQKRVSFLLDHITGG